MEGSIRQSESKDNHDMHPRAQARRELEWLARYFKIHGREDLAEEIFEGIRALRHRAQDSLSSDDCDVVDIAITRKRLNE